MTRFARIIAGKDATQKEPKHKMADYVGRRVSLRIDLVTKGGAKFEAGEVLVCYGHWRGKVHLEDPNNRKRSIRRVPREDVELLP